MTHSRFSSALGRSSSRTPHISESGFCRVKKRALEGSIEVQVSNVNAGIHLLKQLSSSQDVTCEVDTDPWTSRRCGDTLVFIHKAATALLSEDQHNVRPAPAHWRPGQMAQSSAYGK